MSAGKALTDLDSLQLVMAHFNDLAGKIPSEKVLVLVGSKSECRRVRKICRDIIPWNSIRYHLWANIEPGTALVLDKRKMEARN